MTDPVRLTASHGRVNRRSRGGDDPSIIAFLCLNTGLPQNRSFDKIWSKPVTAVEFRHGLHQSEIMTFDSLGFQESFRGVRTQHVPRITAMGACVFGSSLGTGSVPFAPFGPGGDELVANETFEFEPADAHKKPVAFEKTK